MRNLIAICMLLIPASVYGQCKNCGKSTTTTIIQSTPTPQVQIQSGPPQVVFESQTTYYRPEQRMRVYYTEVPMRTPQYQYTSRTGRRLWFPRFRGWR